MSLTAAEIDGSLVALSLVEAALLKDLERLDELFALARQQPEGVLSTLVANLSHLMEVAMGEHAQAQIDLWRAAILRETPCSD